MPALASFPAAALAARALVRTSTGAARSAVRAPVAARRAICSTPSRQSDALFVVRPPPPLCRECEVDHGLTNLCPAPLLPSTAIPSSTTALSVLNDLEPPSALLELTRTSSPTLMLGPSPQIPFEFNAYNMKKAEEIISRYPPQYRKAAVIPLLDLGQRQNDNWTSLSVMNCASRVRRTLVFIRSSADRCSCPVPCSDVAKLLEMPPMRVYEVRSSPILVRSARGAGARACLARPAGPSEPPPPC